MRIVQKGATSQSIYLEVLDSASTTGGRKTGIAFNAAGLTAYYARNGAASVAITLVTQTPSGAYSSGGWAEVDTTNMPGVYRLDVPNAALAAGADSVVITAKGATGMVQVSEEIQLVAWNPQDAVRGGMTALPNANAQAAGGLYTMGSGAGQINQNANGQVDVRIVDPETVRGTAQAGAASSITLAAGASATDNFYNDQVVAIVGGTGVGQARRISSYVGATKVASVDSSWATNPDATSVYALIPFGRVHANVVDDKTGYALAGNVTVGGYAASQDPGTYVLATPANKLATDASGRVTVGAIVNAAIAAATFAANALGAVWDELRASHVVASSFGAGVIVATNNDKTGYTAATVQDKTGYALTAAEHTAVAADVLNATAASYNTAGTIGAKINSAGAAGDPWSTALPGAYGAGTAGAILGALPGSAWDVAIASHTSAGSVGSKLNSLSGASGSGALTVTLTVQNDATHPVAGAQVWVTTDSGGTNIVASGTTDTFGKLTVYLNAGTYYGFAAKPGENFTNPVTLVVS